MPHRILYIEDNVHNMDLVAWLLEDEGFELVQAWTAEEGLEILRKEEIDLVLMDVSLPGMSGMEATRKIRDDDQLKDMPVLAITAHAISDEVARIEASGVNELLTKPLDEDKLMAAIRSYIN